MAEPILASEGHDPAVYSFGPFRVDAESMQLTRNGEVIALAPKVFDTLLVLIRNRNRLVGKDELFRSVWRNVVVSEDSLTQTISMLRRALGDDPNHSVYIATLPRRGYRFVAPVTETGGATVSGPQGILTGPAVQPPTEDTSAGVRQSAETYRRIAAALLALVVLAAAVTAFVLIRNQQVAPAATTPVHLPLDIPAGATLVSGGSLSPDADRVAFIAVDNESGRSEIWLRTMKVPGARALAGTDGGTLPFWSPDGQSIGFFANGRLKVIDLTSNSVRTVATIDGGTPSGGAWSPDGTMLYAGWRSGLFAVDAGGAPRELTVLDSSRQEAAHRRPQFLPDGRHFLYYVDSINAERAGTYVGDLDSAEKVRLIGGRAIYAPAGYVLFVQDRVLMAQRFDAAEGRLTGTPTTVVGNVAPGAEISASAELLTFGGTTAGQLVWMDRSGRTLEALSTPTEMHNPVFSPDGRLVAASSTDGDLRGVWLIDLNSGSATRFVAGANGPSWSPDGSELAFYLETKGVADLYRAAVRGNAEPRLLLQTRTPKTLTDWSRAGLVYVTSSPATRLDLWLFSDQPDGRPASPIVQTPLNEMQGQVSPDGRWLAFASDESGAWDVYVQPVNAPGGKLAVSSGGGAAPRWRPDGRELFYLAPDRMLMSVEVKPGDTWDGERPKPLFRAPVSRGLTARRNYFAVTPDGQRFLFDSDGTRDPIGVLVNWQALLRN